jgi:hypothetical protein
VGVDDNLSEPGVGLAEAIGAVRSDLIAAQREGLGKDLTFGVGKVTVELGGEIRTAAGGRAGVKFWVVMVDAKGERSSNVTHKITVELSPQKPDGTPWKVAGSVSKPPSS